MGPSTGTSKPTSPLVGRGHWSPAPQILELPLVQQWPFHMVVSPLQLHFLCCGQECLCLLRPVLWEEPLAWVSTLEGDKAGARKILRGSLHRCLAETSGAPLPSFEITQVFLKGSLPLPGSMRLGAEP